MIPMRPLCFDFKRGTLKEGLTALLCESVFFPVFELHVVAKSATPSSTMYGEEGLSESGTH